MGEVLKHGKLFTNTPFKQLFCTQREIKKELFVCIQCLQKGMINKDCCNHHVIIQKNKNAFLLISIKNAGCLDSNTK